MTQAYEENDMRTGTYVGVYMKYLLNHIRKRDMDIESVFKNVQADFQVDHIFQRMLQVEP